MGAGNPGERWRRPEDAAAAAEPEALGQGGVPGVLSTLGLHGEGDSVTQASCDRCTAALLLPEHRRRGEGIRGTSRPKSAAQRGRIPRDGALNGPSITSTGCGHSAQLSRTYLMGQQGGSAVTEPWLA